jgi:gamma-glutamyltranspeptidase/glutathione hydrolase
MDLVRLIGRREPLAASLAAGRISAADPDHISLEAGTGAARLLPAMEAAGHRVAEEPIPTGHAFLRRTPSGWEGAADPRRDGAALGVP